MPDQRGFAGSDRPQAVEAYKTDMLVDDIFALADALGLDRFALVGHDWGGAIAWSAALRGDPRLTRLAIVNAPHPVIFQKSLIESPEQRAASQYINAFRTPGFEKIVERRASTGFSTRLSRATSISRKSRKPSGGNISPTGRSPAHSPRCSTGIARQKLVVPPPGVTVPLPDWLLWHSPGPRADAGHLGDEGQPLCFPSSSTGSTRWSTI